MKSQEMQAGYAGRRELPSLEGLEARQMMSVTWEPIESQCIVSPGTALFMRRPDSPSGKVPPTPQPVSAPASPASTPPDNSGQPQTPPAPDAGSGSSGSGGTGDTSGGTTGGGTSGSGSTGSGSTGSGSTGSGSTGSGSTGSGSTGSGSTGSGSTGSGSTGSGSTGSGSTGSGSTGSGSTGSGSTGSGSTGSGSTGSGSTGSGSTGSGGTGSGSGGGTGDSSSTLPGPTTGPVAPIVRSYRLFDGTLYTGKGSLSSYGLEGIYIAYNLNWEDESAVRGAARAAAAAGQVLCLDAELWNIDARQVGDAIAAENVLKLIRVADWAKSERPSLSIGFFGLVPVMLTLEDLKGDYDPAAQWQHASTLVQSLISKVDVLFPNLYSVTTDLSEWQATARMLLEDAARYGKPVYPFVWNRYHEWTPDAALQPVPASDWRAMLHTTRRYADGAVIWGGSEEAFDASAPWLAEARKLVQDTPTVPVAPSGLSVSGRGVRLSWTDNSSGEAGFIIERSADGGESFTQAGVVPQNTTTFVDRHVKGNMPYLYRVRATSAYGDSAPTANVSATGVRDARDAFDPHDWDNVAAVRPRPYYIGFAQDGGWVKYGAVDFGTGLDTFVAELGHPDDTSARHIELRLDGVNGRLVGTLDVQDSGSWSTFVQQRCAIAGADGVHDLYLVFRGSGGVGNLRTFRFESAAQASFHSATSPLQAEGYDRSFQVRVAGSAVTDLDSWDYVAIDNVDFGSGLDLFIAKVASTGGLFAAGARISVRLDAFFGTEVGTLDLVSTGSMSNYVEQSVKLSRTVSGVHTVYLAPQGYKIGSIDSVRFARAA